MNRCIPVISALVAASAIAAYAQQPGTALNAKQLQGRQLLAQSCGVCHLTPSLGARTYGPQLSKVTAGGNDDVMRTIITHGSDRMPAFRHYLKPAEIDAIIAYVRTLPLPPPPPPVRAGGDPQKGGE